jgi:hypothetical protein
VTVKLLTCAQPVTAAAPSREPERRNAAAVRNAVLVNPRIKIFLLKYEGI